MHQISSTRPILGAAYMLGAGLTFAAVNTMTPIITYQLGVPSTAVVFWQYVIATIFALPLILRIGFGSLKTRHPVLHELRAFVSAAGVQVFAFGFASGVPVWQMVALSMTGPFFIIGGSILFLGEKLTVQRLLASVAGFIGALMVSQIGSGGISWTALLPISAAALWGAATVLTKYLAREEAAESLTLYMLVLITPNHFLIGLLLGIGVAVLPHGLLPASLANGFDFGLPGGTALWLILGLGIVTAASQYFLSLAYKVADATYLQPFDDLKLPLNTLIGWLVLSQVPTPWFWPGAALILAASIFILQREARTLRAKAIEETVIAAA
ncbi:MAG: DMT family transporter [Devosia sp.]|nr:DMT family transporter [Devosia sp.]